MTCEQMNPWQYYYQTLYQWSFIIYFCSLSNCEVNQGSSIYNQGYSGPDADPVALAVLVTVVLPAVAVLFLLGGGFIGLGTIMAVGFATLVIHSLATGNLINCQMFVQIDLKVSSD